MVVVLAWVAAWIGVKEEDRQQTAEPLGRSRLDWLAAAECAFVAQEDLASEAARPKQRGAAAWALVGMQLRVPSKTAVAAATFFARHWGRQLS